MKSKPALYHGVLTEGPRVLFSFYAVGLVASFLITLASQPVGLMGLIVFGWLEWCRERVDHIDVDTPGGSRRFLLRRRGHQFKVTSGDDEGVLTRTYEGDWLDAAAGKRSRVFYFGDKLVMTIRGNGIWQARSVEYDNRAAVYSWCSLGGRSLCSTRDFVIEDEWADRKRVVFAYRHPFLMPCLSCILDNEEEKHMAAG